VRCGRVPLPQEENNNAQSNELPYSIAQVCADRSTLRQIVTSIQGKRLFLRSKKEKNIQHIFERAH
jgi:hypothetical protein